MQRKPVDLTGQEFDVLIVGGGAFGAAAARDAALRGLRTALIEREDFGSGASAECFKMLHGGLRYLRHFDLARLRRSSTERGTLLRIAPHLVRPVPIVVPTYGRSGQGKFLPGMQLRTYDWLTRHRNADIHDPTRQIQNGRLLSRDETLELFPDLDSDRLNGATVFEDGQVYHPARLVLAFIKSAVAADAVACNYIEAVDFLRRGTAVRGVRVHDRLSGEGFDVRAKLVLNAAGPWAERLLAGARSSPGEPKRGAYSRDACLVFSRKPVHPFALAPPGGDRSPGARAGREAQHLFITPWRDCMLAGIWHKVTTESPDKTRVDRREIQQWVQQIGSILPGLALREDEVSSVCYGLVPFDGFSRQTRLIDHRAEQGVDGIVTLIGARFASARMEAARALDLLLKQLPTHPASAATDRLPLSGGAIEDFSRLRALAGRTWAGKVGDAALDALLRNHGRDYNAVLTSRTARNRVDLGTLTDTATLAAEVVYAVREEAAVRLDDAILRRTDMGNAHHPGYAALEQAADLMGDLLGWSPRRRSEEIASCEQVLRRHHAGTRLAMDTASPSGMS